MLIYGTLGWCAVALALVGVFVPGMPTTVFVIAAAYCFSRSSPRFERWLREHPLLGPFLRRVAPGGGMPASAKRAALTAMWTAVLLSSAVLAGVQLAASVATIGLGIVGTFSILFAVRTAPEPPPSALAVVQSNGLQPTLWSIEGHQTPECPS